MFLTFNYERELLDIAGNLLQKGNVSEARCLLERGTQHFPASVGLKLLFAEALSRLGDFVQSSILYQQIEKIDSLVEVPKKLPGYEELGPGLMVETHQFKGGHAKDKRFSN